MGKVINYFTPGSGMAKNEARIYGGAMIATIFIRLAFDHHYNLLTFKVGMRMRVACCSLVYRKVKYIEPRYIKIQTVKKNMTFINYSKVLRYTPWWRFCS
jgi:hypothetical protein